MKKFILNLFILLPLFALVYSCNDSDDKKYPIDYNLPSVITHYDKDGSDLEVIVFDYDDYRRLTSITDSVKTKEVDEITTYSISYDGNNRVEQLIVKEGSGNNTYKFEYGKDSVKITGEVNYLLLLDGSKIDSLYCFKDDSYGIGYTKEYIYGTNGVKNINFENESAAISYTKTYTYDDKQGVYYYVNTANWFLTFLFETIIVDRSGEYPTELNMNFERNQKSIVENDYSNYNVTFTLIYDESGKLESQTYTYGADVEQNTLAKTTYEYTVFTTVM